MMHGAMLLPLDMVERAAPWASKLQPQQNSKGAAAESP